MKTIQSIFLTFIIIIFQGCATVDIRSTELKNSSLQEPLVSKGRRILQQAVWNQDRAGQWDTFDEWKIVVKDLWKSNIIRRLTPITQSDQRLEFQFDLKKDQAQMKYLNGKRIDQVLGFENGETYHLVNNERRYKRDNRLRLYLIPVRNYFFWPQALVDSEIIIYDGEARLRGQSYHKVFVTSGSWESSPKTDQYMIWIHQNRMQIEFIQFTLRDLFKSYQGVVAYSDYREVQGMNLPHQIDLKETINTSKYSHQFLVEKMDFKKRIKETLSDDPKIGNIDRLPNVSKDF